MFPYVSVKSDRRGRIRRSDVDMCFTPTVYSDGKEQGKNTCPTCRKIFDASHFKIVVTIQNNYTAAANSVSLNEESIFDVLDLFDITFDVENQPDLDSILADLGVSLTDFDSSVLDAE
jgi:hypothetical protein